MSSLALGGMLAIGAAHVGSTSALFSDNITAAQVSVSGASVNSPTSVSVALIGATPRVSWGAPVGGLTPDSYDIWRRVSPAAAPGVVIATPTTSPYDDTSAQQCDTLTYSVQSRFMSLRSGLVATTSVYIDTIAPTVTASAIVATSNATAGNYIANWVKASGQYYAYANITDVCAASNTLTASFALVNLNGGTVAATAGAWTPVAGGPSYNFRAGPFTTGAYADGSIRTWTISATDPTGNTTGLLAATNATTDAVAPTISLAHSVPASTGWYLPGAVRAEVAPSTLYNVYAQPADTGSGVAIALGAGGVQATIINNIVSYTLDLGPGSFNTGNGVTWTYRTAVPASVPALTAGNYSFKVQASDRVGNLSLAYSGSVTVNTTAPTATCALANANSSVANTDTVTLTFSEAMFPGAFSPSWTSIAALSGQTATFVDSGGAVADYMTSSVTFLKGGAGAANNLSLGGANWIAASYPTSTFTRTNVNYRVFALTLGGGPTNASGTLTSALAWSPALVDATGLSLATASSVCSGSF